MEKIIESMPENIKSLLNKLDDDIQSILKDNFVGLYIHGSLTMGSFNPRNSDVDFIVIVKDKLSVEDKKALADILLKSDKGTEKGLEMSIVLQKYALRFEYPTPFEFHFSKSCEQDHKENKVDYTEELKDPDLAAHFVNLKARGLRWSGLPIDQVFSEVPREYYLKSLFYDFEDLDKNLQQNPVYGILNVCRMIAYLKNNLILSKAEGAQWALKNLDQKYSLIISQASKIYTDPEHLYNSENWDKNELLDFSGYAKDLVKSF